MPNQLRQLVSQYVQEKILEKMISMVEAAFYLKFYFTTCHNFFGSHEGCVRVRT